MPIIQRHLFAELLFAPPDPLPPPKLLFFFSFLSRSLSRARGGRLGECGIQRGPDRKPFGCGVGEERGRGSQGVSARTEAEDEDRRRPALGGVPIARFCKS